jgi:polar amino acid transport system substrate-binding protein
MRRYFAFALSLLLMPLSAAATASDNQKTIHIVGDSWCPYNCEASAAQQGYMIDIARRALNKHGYELRYTNVPWSRAIEETRSGKYHAIVGAANDDAPDFIFPTQSLGRIQNEFYVLHDNPWRFRTFDDLNAVRLGAIADYAYTQELDDYIAKNRKNMQRVQLVFGEIPLELNVRKLQKGRIDTLVEDISVMQYFLKQKSLGEQIIPAGEIQNTDGKFLYLYIAFSPQLPNGKMLAEIISNEVQSMRKSGELAALLSTYGVADWNP